MRNFADEADLAKRRERRRESVKRFFISSQGDAGAGLVCLGVLCMLAVGWLLSPLSIALVSGFDEHAIVNLTIGMVVVRVGFAIVIAIGGYFCFIPPQIVLDRMRHEANNPSRDKLMKQWHRHMSWSLTAFDELIRFEDLELLNFERERERAEVTMKLIEGLSFGMMSASFDLTELSNVSLKYEAWQEECRRQREYAEALSRIWRHSGLLGRKSVLLTRSWYLDEDIKYLQKSGELLGLKGIVEAYLEGVPLDDLLV